MTNPLRILFPTLGAFAVASVIGIGVVMAQAGDDATPAAGDETPAAPSVTDHEERINGYLDQLAENLGVTREALDAGLKQTALDMLDQAVADGLIDADRAAEIREKIESGEAPLGIGPFGGGGFRGHGGHHGGGFPGGPFHDHGDDDGTTEDDTETSLVS